MMNFNPERFSICVQANRLARICLSDAIAYARQRKTFGRRLIDHQVIRSVFCVVLVFFLSVGVHAYTFEHVRVRVRRM